MTENAQEAAERRQYYRIDDDVALKYRLVGHEELDSALSRLKEGYPDLLGVASAFADMNVRMNHALDKCRQEGPELALYLEGLNEKLDTLIHLLAVSDAGLPDRPTHRVNLSASGIRFNAREDIPEGASLEIKIVFFPSFLCMMSFGTVVRCIRGQSTTPGYPYDIAVEFLYMRESDRELLVRHVLQKESTTLRAARQMS
jgi:hypothetical protein